MATSGPTPLRGHYLRLGFIIVIFAVLAFLADVIASFLVRTLDPAGLAYIVYVKEGVAAAIVGVGGYLVIRAALGAVEAHLTPRYGRGNTQLVLLVLRLAFYAFLVAAVLAAFGFNLTGVVVGGAIGGLVLGLAIQSLAASMLAGFFVSGTKTIQPMDHAILQSWIWGSIPVRVSKVGLLFTDGVTANGNVVKVPNSALVGSGTFTKLDSDRDASGFYYPLQVTTPADVPAEKILPGVLSRLAPSHLLRGDADLVFATKNGSTNVFTAILHVPSISQLNSAMDTTNRAFDAAYWSAKTG